MRENLRFVCFLTHILFFVSSFNFILCQTGSVHLLDPFSISLAGTVTANARGVYSLSANPANLSIDNEFNLELVTAIPFPNLFFRGGINFFNIKEYNHFFGGQLNDQGSYVARILTDKDKKRFINLFDDDAKIKANISSNIFSFYYNFKDYLGAFGFSANEIIFASAKIPKSLSYFIAGNEVNKTYDLSSADFKTSWYRVYSFSYSNEILQFLDIKDYFLSVGFSIKYYNGYFLVKNNRSHGKINIGDMAQITADYHAELLSSFSPNLGLKHLFENDSITYKRDLTPYLKPAGSGFGYDIGIYFKPLNFIGISAAVKDIGKIIWHQKTATYRSTGDFYFDGIQDLIDSLTRDDKIDSILNRFVRDTSFFSPQFYTKTPANFRLGLCVMAHKLLPDYDGILQLSFDLTKGFNKEFMNSLKYRYSFGFEFQLEKYRPIIRIGYSYGGDDFNYWSAGLAYNYEFFEIAFSATDVQYLVKNLKYFNRIGIAFGTKWTL